jgi:hypothetical protein
MITNAAKLRREAATNPGKIVTRFCPTSDNRQLNTFRRLDLAVTILARGCD